MVILFKSYGDHSNRLLQNLRIEVYCIDNNIEFRNTTFGDLSIYYINPVNSQQIQFSNILQNRIVQFFFKIFSPINIISLGKEKDSISALSNCLFKNCYVKGWYNFDKNNILIRKYQDLMIKKYTLKKNYYKNNPLFLKMLSLDKSKTILIGVHIRRGDYKKWNNGKYYFKDEQYRTYMRKMKKEINIHINKKCIFIIFSNEKTSFEESDTLWISKNTWYLDHFLMGQCDYLIGPPSTFTVWASYIGKTKYIHIKSSEQKIELKHFTDWT